MPECDFCDWRDAQLRLVIRDTEKRDCVPLQFFICHLCENKLYPLMSGAGAADKATCRFCGREDAQFRLIVTDTEVGDRVTLQSSICRTCQSKLYNISETKEWKRHNDDPE